MKIIFRWYGYREPLGESCDFLRAARHALLEKFPGLNIEVGTFRDESSTASFCYKASVDPIEPASMISVLEMMESVLGPVYESWSFAIEGHSYMAEGE